MKITEFEKRFERNTNLLIAIESLFLNRKVKRTKSMVQIETFASNEHISLSTLLNAEDEGNISVVYVLPCSFLSEEKTKGIRQGLIEKDLLDTIVLIPSNWLDNVSEDFALLYLNNNNRQKGVVKFIDITYDSGSDIAPNGWSVANLIFYDAFPDNKNLRGEIDEEQQDLLVDYFDEYNCVVGHHKIKTTGYSLEPARYIKRLPFFNGYHLYELWNTVDKKVRNAKGKIIHDYDLKDSASHYEIDVLSIESQEGYDNYYVLNGKFILVAQKGKLRPTLIDTKGYTIYVPCKEISAIVNDDDELLDDYVICELRKPYVEWQLDKWKSEQTSYLRIHVPDNTNDKSSVEMQRESFVQSKFHDVCEYCKHPDLLYLLAMLGKEEIKNDSSVPNKIRNVMENYVLPLLYKNGIKPKEDKKCYTPNVKTNISGYSKALPEGTPRNIEGSFYTISFLAPEGSHDYEDTKIQKTIREGLCPYLTTSLVYDLINIIMWCKQFENKTR
jgi:hypothetical protein